MTEAREAGSRLSHDEALLRIEDFASHQTAANALVVLEELMDRVDPDDPVVMARLGTAVDDYERFQRHEEARLVAEVNRLHTPPAERQPEIDGWVRLPQIELTDEKHRAEVELANQQLAIMQQLLDRFRSQGLPEPRHGNRLASLPVSVHAFYVSVLVPGIDGDLLDADITFYGADADREDSCVYTVRLSSRLDADAPPGTGERFHVLRSGEIRPHGREGTVTDQQRQMVQEALREGRAPGTSIVRVTMNSDEAELVHAKLHGVTGQLVSLHLSLGKRSLSCEPFDGDEIVRLKENEKGDGIAVGTIPPFWPLSRKKPVRPYLPPSPSRLIDQPDRFVESRTRPPQPAIRSGQLSEEARQSIEDQWETWATSSDPKKRAVGRRRLKERGVLPLEDQPPIDVKRVEKTLELGHLIREAEALERRFDGVVTAANQLEEQLVVTELPSSLVGELTSSLNELRGQAERGAKAEASLLPDARAASTQLEDETSDLAEIWASLPDSLEAETLELGGLQAQRFEEELAELRSRLSHALEEQQAERRKNQELTNDRIGKVGKRLRRTEEIGDAERALRSRISDVRRRIAEKFEGNPNQANQFLDALNLSRDKLSDEVYTPLSEKRSTLEVLRTQLESLEEGADSEPLWQEANGVLTSLDPIEARQREIEDELQKLEAQITAAQVPLPAPPIDGEGPPTLKVGGEELKPEDRAALEAERDRLRERLAAHERGEFDV